MSSDPAAIVGIVSSATLAVLAALTVARFGFNLGGHTDGWNVGTFKATSPTADQERSFATAGPRAWFDEQMFKHGELQLVRDAFKHAGAIHVGDPGKDNTENIVAGFDAPTEWDILWTKASIARQAIPFLAAWQMINFMPGLEPLSRKEKFARTMLDTFKTDAHAFIPRTFQIRSSLEEWKAWADPECPRETIEQCLWMLKNEQHMGKGLAVLPRAEAEQKALDSSRKYVIAQKYLNNPLLIDGQKFGIRLWVLVTSCTPLRSYLHQRGLVLFSSSQYDNSEKGSEGHFTNARQNPDGKVWTLTEFKDYIGTDNFQGLWRKMKRAIGMSVSATLPTCRKDAERLQLRPGTSFQLIGVDFLVTDNLTPWLIEFNIPPSLSLHGNEKVDSAKIASEKGSMLKDLVSTLGVSVCRPSRPPPSLALNQADTDKLDDGGDRDGDDEKNFEETGPSHAICEEWMRSTSIARGLDKMVKYSQQEITSVSAEEKYDSMEEILCNRKCADKARSVRDDDGKYGSCLPCLTVDDLRTLSALEWELASRGEFEPVMTELHEFCSSDNQLHTNATSVQNKWKLLCHASDGLAASWMTARLGALADLGPWNLSDNAIQNSSAAEESTERTIDAGYMTSTARLNKAIIGALQATICPKE